MSKSFWGSLLFAIALWGYSSLNAEYQTFIDVPLSVKIPSSRALESSPPRSVYVDVRGTGWNLFNLIFFNRSKQCFIDLSKEIISDSIYKISKIDIQKSLQFLKNVNPINVLPENINLLTGKVSEYEVYVAPRVAISTRNGFAVVGKITVEPEKVKIRGNERIVQLITRWETEPELLEDVSKPFSKVVNLIDTLPGVVDVFPKKVTIKCDVQQVGETIINDIPISVANGSLPDGHLLQPPILTLTLQGGIDIIADLTPNDVTAFIDFDKIMSDSTGILKPIIKLPPNITLLKADPPYIYHTIISKPRGRQ